MTTDLPDSAEPHAGIETPSIVVACVDANVLLSALGFGGSPQLVVDRLLAGDFLSVTGPNILTEVRRNAIGKLRLPTAAVDMFLNNIREASTVYVPDHTRQYIPHVKDNAVLDVALTGGCHVLVTGDRKHLLPLSPFRGLLLEPPSRFLQRLTHLAR